MVDRRLIGDLCLAVLLVLPTAVLAKAEAPAWKVEQVNTASALHAGASATPTQVGGRISLLG